MTRASGVIDVASMPDLARLADEVQRTRRPQLLQRDGEDVALLVPVTPSTRRPVRRPLSTRYPTIASLAGAAGSLRKPMSWKEIQAVVREERAEAHHAKHR